MSITYFAILAECDISARPLGLRLDFDLRDVMEEVRKYWPEADKIRVVWKDTYITSDLTADNCKATLDLLAHRSRKDILKVFF